MAHFMIGENGETITNFDLPLNRKVKLVQWGGDGTGNRCEVAAAVSPPPIEVTTLPDKLAALSTAFTVRGHIVGTSATLVGYVSGSGRTQKYTPDLRVVVWGQPRPHPRYDADLLADVAVTGNAQRVRLYTKFLLGPQNRLNALAQNTSTGKFDCGDAASAIGPALFGKATHYQCPPFYKPIQSKPGEVRLCLVNRLGPVCGGSGGSWPGGRWPGS